jgi:hypothetical protein
MISIRLYTYLKLFYRIKELIRNNHLDILVRDARQYDVFPDGEHIIYTAKANDGLYGVYIEGIIKKEKLIYV